MKTPRQDEMQNRKKSSQASNASGPADWVVNLGGGGGRVMWRGGGSREGTIAIASTVSKCQVTVMVPGYPTGKRGD